MAEITKAALCGLNLTNGACFGYAELKKALEDRGIPVTEKAAFTDLAEGEVLVAAGRADDLRMATILAGAGASVFPEAGSLLIKACATREGKVLAVSGPDDAGVMYGLLELARRVKKSGLAALAEPAETKEKPDNAVRCMDRYIVGHLDNEWFQSEDFWRYYLDRLAKARFNRLSLIVGFDTPYMAPPYPFFLQSVDGYPEVKRIGFTDEDAEKNLWWLRRIVDLCHAYSIEFVLATWQQRPWTALQEPLVEGLPESETGLMDYCYAGLKQLLLAVPDIDVVSFRVNHESGVGTQVSAEDFWNRCADAVADAGRELGKAFVLDLRAKGLTEAMIAHAYGQGLQVEVPTKYWCEHAALPYHLSVMRTEELERLDNYNHSRRYSYADMLEQPLRYPVIYRLWNYGSTNLFLWADAEYIRRFSKSCSIGGSSGFQVNAPLSLKYGYEASHKERWDTFADPSLRYGRYEEERFYSWYTMFGRIGYNTACDPEVWQDEFLEHFGEDCAELVEKTLSAASQIVPFVTTVHMPVHPSLRYWTEMNTGWALFAENNYYPMEHYDSVSSITYGSTEPSDHGLFYGIDEYAKDVASGRLAGKQTPYQYAGWLDALAATVEKNLTELKYDLDDNAETRAFTVDCRMLVWFARYHAAKIRSAMALAFWRETGDLTWLQDAEVMMVRAIDFWDKLSADGKKYYYHDLDFSTAGTKTRRGTWADLRPELTADLESLQKLLAENHTAPDDVPLHSYTFAAPPEIVGALPEVAFAGQPLKVRVAVLGDSGTPVLHYRHLNQKEGLFKEVPMIPDGDGFSAYVPGDYITPSWQLQLYVTAAAKNTAVTIFPGVYHEDYLYPYAVIPVKA